jgi:hypothetical protein
MEVYSNYKEKLLLGSRACFLRNKTSMLITMAKKWGRLYYTVTKQYPLHTDLAGNQWYTLKYAKGWNIDSRLITSQMLETLGFNGAHDM